MIKHQNKALYQDNNGRDGLGCGCLALSNAIVIKQHPAPFTALIPIHLRSTHFFATAKKFTKPVPYLLSFVSALFFEAVIILRGTNENKCYQWSIFYLTCSATSAPVACSNESKTYCFCVCTYHRPSSYMRFIVTSICSLLHLSVPKCCEIFRICVYSKPARAYVNISCFNVIYAI